MKIKYFYNFAQDWYGLTRKEHIIWLATTIPEILFGVVSVVFAIKWAIDLNLHKFPASIINPIIMSLCVIAMFISYKVGNYWYCKARLIKK
jgi:hypothetical protein